MLTSNKLRLIAQFLTEYADRLGNDTCNDYSLLDTPENRQILADMEQWNCPYNPEEWVDPIVDGDSLLTRNYFLCGYLANLCSTLAQREEDNKRVHEIAKIAAMNSAKIFYPELIEIKDPLYFVLPEEYIIKKIWFSEVEACIYIEHYNEIKELLRKDCFTVAQGIAVYRHFKQSNSFYFSIEAAITALHQK